MYLLWSLLNIGLFIFFIVICFKAIRLVKEEVGLMASIVFVLGLLSFGTNSNDDKNDKEPNSDQIKTWRFISPDSIEKNSKSSVILDLEKTLMSKNSLLISYGKDTLQKNFIPMSANSWTTGFVSGTKWRPRSIIVNRTAQHNKFEYFVDGTIEWNLFGSTFYTKAKSYQGFVLVK